MSNVIEMVAIDSFHLSGIGQHHARSKFDVESEKLAKELEEKGLAKRLFSGESSTQDSASVVKRAAPLQNKMVQPAANKKLPPNKTQKIKR